MPFKDSPNNDGKYTLAVCKLADADWNSQADDATIFARASCDYNNFRVMTSLDAEPGKEVVLTVMDQKFSSDFEHAWNVKKSVLATQSDRSWQTDEAKVSAVVEGM